MKFVSAGTDINFFAGAALAARVGHKEIENAWKTSQSGQPNGNAAATFLLETKKIRSSTARIVAGASAGTLSFAQGDVDLMDLLEKWRVDSFEFCGRTRPRSTSAFWDQSAEKVDDSAFHLGHQPTPLEEDGHRWLGEANLVW